MRILAVGSGKGGVGKSLLACNLAVVLAQAGRRVVLVDLDLGGGNLHMLLGLPSVYQGIGTFLENREMTLRDILYPTMQKNLAFIPGDLELPRIANLSTGAKRRLVSRLAKLEKEGVDYLILDLGAGTSVHVIDFFLLAGEGIVVIAPTRPSMANAYLFLKNSLFRIASRFFKENETRKILKRMENVGSPTRRMRLAAFLKEIEDVDPAAYKSYQSFLTTFRPTLIMNKIENPQDVRLARQLQHVVMRSLGIDLRCDGSIYQDEWQKRALEAKMPLALLKPRAILTQEIHRIVGKILTREDAPGFIMSGEEEGKCLQIEQESQNDFLAKKDLVKGLLHCGDLTDGELIETIKGQIYELDQLRKENRFLKREILKRREAGK